MIIKIFYISIQVRGIIISSDFEMILSGKLLTEAISRQQVSLFSFSIWHIVNPVPMYEANGG